MSQEAQSLAVARLVASPVGTAFAALGVARLVGPTVPGTYAQSLAVSRLLAPEPAPDTIVLQGAAVARLVGPYVAVGVEPVTNRILDAVLALLAVDHSNAGLGPGWHDLRGRVRLGREATPKGSALPALYIEQAEAPTFRDSDALGALNLGQYGRDINLVIWAMSKAANRSPGARMKAANRLRLDIHNALEADPGLGGLAYDVEVNSAPVLAQVQHAPPGAAVAIVQVVYRVRGSI